MRPLYKVAAWVGGGAVLAYLLSEGVASAAPFVPGVEPPVPPPPGPRPAPEPVPDRGIPDREHPEVFPVDQFSGAGVGAVRPGFGWRSPSPVQASSSYYVQCRAPQGCHVHVAPNAASGTVGVAPAGSTACCVGGVRGWLHVRMVDANKRAVDGWVPAHWWSRR